MLACQRHLFSLPDDVHYLNCASRAPLLRSAETAGIAGLRRQLVPEAQPPEQLFADGEAVRRRMGRLVGAPADAVALVPAVSYPMAVAARHAVTSGALRAGRNVVVPAGEFPSVVYAWRSACAETGATLREVPRPPLEEPAPGAAWNARLLETIDADTAVVALSTVAWTEGLRFDMAAVARRARDVGALLCLDGTQSVGAEPFDWAAVAPDLLACAGYKWLLGPYQTSVAVFGGQLADAAPIEQHWSNRAGAEDVRSIGLREDYRAGARRFDVGEHANPITLPMLGEGLSRVLAWGPAAVAAYCAALWAPVLPALAEAGWRLPPVEERVAHILGVHVPDDARRDALAAALHRHNVRASVRGTAVRFSPHVYNTPADMAALANALRAAGPP